MSGKCKFEVLEKRRKPRKLRMGINYLIRRVKSTERSLDDLFGKLDRPKI